MTGGREPKGVRARKTGERDDAIRKAAMGMARRGKWPSPSSVAKRTGISESVVERRTGILLGARREWVRVTGRSHPQWRDPAAVEAMPAEAEVGPSEPSVPAVRDEREKATLKKQRRTIADLRRRIAELEELVRRLQLGVRPPEIGLILEVGTPQRATGKTKKGVGVRPR
ncbi:hypothetical protein KZX46_10440 [Polymorphobacter sp. PAMC 29334]|uniref:hypothetical protein n=1 Tax=Polymorphobacter sp. PAMC 29334 TaxID=2862331 RepID=UPI001C783909|nr:hypothetical protein [Polymorphobacter sp. PAMC 29334]QYE36301.1 hypothetical protein KZX46_10440 [Polymorphobacter sp. PAMC 29334]